MSVPTDINISVKEKKMSKKKKKIKKQKFKNVILKLPLCQ